MSHPKLTIPFHRPDINENDISAVAEVLRSGWITSGPMVRQFEEAFKTYIGCEHAVAVNSCTAAMHLALAGLGIEPGDRVITSPYTFVATAEAIQYLGAQPLFVDIRAEDLNIDPGLIEQALQKANGKVKAILPVHVAGHPCDMEAIMQLAERYTVRVVEDAAHALETRARFSMRDPKWRKIGAIGDASCFSFYATKNITTGEGGMVTTNDAELAEKMRCLALHGLSRDAWKRYTAEGNWYYEVEEQGFKYNMPDILAALGLSQLQRVGEMHARRCEIAQIYRDELGDLPELLLPGTNDDLTHAWHLYIVRLRSQSSTIDRNTCIEKLKAAGVSTSVHFIPLHLHPYYRKRYGCRAGDFPVAEAQYESAVSLPIFPKMSDEQVGYVAARFKEIIKEAA